MQLDKRARLLCGIPGIDVGCVELDWKGFHNNIVGVSKSLGPRMMMILIKSWLNSWTTSTRMHEDETGECIFCCGGGDALHHYLRCDHLWTLLISCAGLNVKWLTKTPAQRLGFVEPNSTSLLLLVVAFKVYHGMKGARGAEGHIPVGVDCFWALELINHFIGELPSKLRRVLSNPD